MSLALTKQELLPARSEGVCSKESQTPIGQDRSRGVFLPGSFFAISGEIGFWEPLSRDPLGVSALAGFVSELRPKRFLLLVQPWKWLG